MLNNKKLVMTGDETEARQQLVWKGAILLMCLGLFALVIWSGAREDAMTAQCANTDQATHDACIASQRPQTPMLPAKGGARLLDSPDRHSNWNSHAPSTTGQ